ncbi:arginase family protein [Puerhibacterium sp. TATVAM-FAB25]|uniref:arginase family protein n=1 Tax=Puerhibacterium sp. TATVAM-FAB25 TaxID=3093699 RepID=UPI00397DC5E1
MARSTVRTAAGDERPADAVAAAVSAGRFPLVFGGDCSALLGSVRGARDAAGSVGLVHVDGHEDTTPIDASEDGEAANCEIGILLGMAGRSMSAAARAGLPALAMPALALVGQRDDAWRRGLNLGSLAQLGVWKRDGLEVAADPEEFPAQGLPEHPDEPGGLTRDELLRLVRSAAAERGCVGASIAIYDPEQDPDGSGARFVVDLARALVEHLGGWLGSQA